MKAFAACREWTRPRRPKGVFETKPRQKNERAFVDGGLRSGFRQSNHHVSFATHGKLDAPVDEVAHHQCARLVADGDIVNACASASD